MARRPRLDGPDTWHHAMNRPIARRTLFETAADYRYFLSLLARQVRAGRLEVHAFSLMMTHYHLLVRSVNGELSEAMRQIQYRYSRYFNRTRKRDGSLFRGRFLSCPIHDLAYRRNVLAYIHDNPVAAAVVAHPRDHAWSSAGHLARSTRPTWLATDWVDEELAARGEGETAAEQLATAFPSRIDDDFRSWVEKKLSQRYFVEDEDVSLHYAGSPKVVAWTVRKAELADGTKPWQTVSPPGLVETLAGKACEKIGPLLGRFAHHSKDAWNTLRAGLLRMLAGCTHHEIGLRIGRHAATISRDIRDHARLIEADPDYDALANRLTHAVLAAAR